MKPFILEKVITKVTQQKTTEQWGTEFKGKVFVWTCVRSEAANGKSS